MPAAHTIPAPDDEQADVVTRGLAALAVDETPSPSGLPTELTDAIIDHLHDDKSSLLSCSLVCSQWLESSRNHLFHSIIVRGGNDERGFDAFIAFLERTPAIRIYIRQLTFRVRSALAKHAKELRSIGPYVLTFMLRTLPALRALILDNVTWDKTLLTGRDGNSVDWPPLAAPLDALTLSRVVTEELVTHKIFLLRDLIEVLWAFGPLHRLNLTNLNLETQRPSPVLPEFPERLHLEELFVHANYTRIGASEALIAINSVISKHLRKVDIACNDDNEAPVVGQFLRIVGSTLKELRLDLSEMTVLRAFNAPGPWQMFSLPSLTALTTLELNVWTAGAHITGDLFTYDGQWCLCSVPPILALLPPTLHVLILTLSISGYPHPLRTHLDALPWPPLIAQLARFPAMHTLRLALRPRRGHNVLPEALYAVADIAARRLRALDAAGVLEIDVSTEGTPVTRPER